MKYFARISVAALVLGTLWFGDSTHASAQVLPGQKNIESYDVNRMDVREAIRSLFRQIGVSYAIAPDVQGVVTVSLKNVSFEIALQNVLRQVDATWRIEGGVYEVVRKDNPVRFVPDPNYEAPAQFGGSVQAEPSATMTVDGKYLYILRGTEIYKFDKDSLRLEKAGSLNEASFTSAKK